MNFRKQWGIWLAVLIVLGFVILAITAKRPTITATGIIAPALSATDHIKGNSQAKNILIGYGDFQCPACALYEPLLNQLAKEFPDTLAIVFRNFPLRSLHKNADTAAAAAEAADKQGKFWEMHDLLYSRQIDWEKSTDVKSIFTRYANELGLDVARFTVDLNLPEIKAKIDNDYQADTSMGLSSTPTFFINGKQILKNPSSYDEFKALLR